MRSLLAPLWMAIALFAVSAPSAVAGSLVSSTYLYGRPHHAGTSRYCLSNRDDGPEEIEIFRRPAPTCRSATHILRLARLRVPVFSHSLIAGWRCDWYLGGGSCRRQRVVMDASIQPVRECRPVAIAAVPEEMEIDIYGRPAPTCRASIALARTATMLLPIEMVGEVSGWGCLWGYSVIGCTRDLVNVDAVNPGD